MKFKNIDNMMIEWPCAFEDVYVGDMLFYKGVYLMKINDIHMDDGYCNVVCIGVKHKSCRKIIGKLGWIGRTEDVGLINREFVPD